ncbi:MAG: PD-(D/E)XK nuclease family protein [Bacteroidaceae bacterium]|nr:PD-(D/E)XK nuclease family protein [Bacteroidaceae bacterium]
MNEEIKEIFSLLDDYVSYKREVRNKYPYHVNPIEEIRANENANSRILGTLLRYEHNGEYKILKSFLERMLPEFRIEKLSKPVIESEQYRIDLSVREAGKYAIIFENKIHNAVLQKNQLARYIEKLHDEEHFSYNQIYVIFMPPTVGYESNDCCWHKFVDGICGKCDNGECKLNYSPELRKMFKNENRYKKITFRDDLLNWLKEDVLPNLTEKEELLKSSVILYIDYLEGLFQLRMNEKNIYMELRDFIVKKLKLDDKVLEGKIDVLQQEKEKIDSLCKELENMRLFYMWELIEEKMKPIVENIAKSYELECDLRVYNDGNRTFSLGFKRKDWDLNIIFACFVNCGMDLYIGKHNAEPISGYSTYKCINGWNGDSSDREKFPHGCVWLKKYENKILDLLRDVTVDDGAEFKRFLEDKLYHTLKEIEGHPNEITMKISSSQ